jgi:hypothetical protein
LLDNADFVRLSAFSLSGHSVSIGDECKHKVSWAYLWDSFVCIIDCSGSVSIPYAVFHNIADWNLNDFDDKAYKEKLNRKSGQFDV